LNPAARFTLISIAALLGAMFVAALAWTAPSADAQDSQQKRTVFGLTTNDRLVAFRPANPRNLISDKRITGIGDDTLVGMDVRPKTGKLFAVGESGAIYSINMNNARASERNQITVPLAGSSFGVDFNPMADALRVVSDTGQNLRIGEGGLGDTFTDTPLVYETGDENVGPVPAVGAGYTNNVADAPSTALYYIDAENDVLATVAEGGTANTGPVATVGDLGVNTTPLVGFDIAPSYGNLVSLTPQNGRTALYAIDLETGETQRRGVIGRSGNVEDIAAKLLN
jgi:hypothetical protein